MAQDSATPGQPSKDSHGGARGHGRAPSQGGSSADSVALSVINFNKIPMPIFDTFKQVFIVTDGAESFYMDLDGEYDQQLPNTI